MGFADNGHRFYTQAFGTFVPRAYSQNELLEHLTFHTDPFAKSVSMHSKIDFRCFSEHPTEVVRKGASFETSSQYHRVHAPEMAYEALLASTESSSNESLSDLDGI